MREKTSKGSTKKAKSLWILHFLLTFYLWLFSLLFTPPHFVLFSTMHPCSFAFYICRFLRTNSLTSYFPLPPRPVSYLLFVSFSFYLSLPFYLIQILSISSFLSFSFFFLHFFVLLLLLHLFPCSLLSPPVIHN